MKEHVPEYCVHTSDTIKGFRGDYRFLSNFPSFENPIVFDGVEYKSTELAYVAGKTESKTLRKIISKLGPGDAKKLGRAINSEGLAPNPLWNNNFRVELMKDLNLQKFQNNLDQKERLLATGDAYIVEANDWHDNFFGECVCENCPKDKMPEGGPLNHLGKILMEVRLQLK